MVNKYKKVRASLILNNSDEATLIGVFFISNNPDWASDVMRQRSEIKTVSQTTPILFHKTPGLIMRWWEN